MSRSVSLSYVRKYYPDVKKVIDAKRGTKITVKEADCTNGVGKAPNICAIAKAAMRQYDGAIISLSRAYLIKGDIATRYEVPSHVMKDLVVFDRAHIMEPGIYRLDRVPPKRGFGAPRAQGPNAGKKPSKRKQARAKHFHEGVRSLRHPS